MTTRSRQMAQMAAQLAADVTALARQLAATTVARVFDAPKARTRRPRAAPTTPREARATPESRVVAYLKTNPGARAADLRAALRMPQRRLRLVLAGLRADRRIRAHGRTRACLYFVNSGPARSAATN